jgi:hypothetical protein
MRLILKKIYTEKKTYCNCNVRHYKIPNVFPDVLILTSEHRSDSIMVQTKTLEVQIGFLCEPSIGKC